LKISTEKGMMERVLVLMFSMAIGFVAAAAGTECVYDGWKQNSSKKRARNVKSQENKG
jgi:hypothetical protein